jgi:hypothetical protein
MFDDKMFEWEVVDYDYVLTSFSLMLLSFSYPSYPPYGDLEQEVCSY